MTKKSMVSSIMTRAMSFTDFTITNSYNFLFNFWLSLPVDVLSFYFYYDSYLLCQLCDSILCGFVTKSDLIDDYRSMHEKDSQLPINF